MLRKSDPKMARSERCALHTQPEDRIARRRIGHLGFDYSLCRAEINFVIM